MFTNNKVKTITAWIFLVLMINIVSPPPIALANSKVTLPAGTPIMCKFTEAFDAALVSPGQTISLQVVADVIVDGVVVIKSFTPVMAQITDATPKGPIGKPAAITVIIQNVTAIDGSKIPVTGRQAAIGDNKQSDALIITILCCILGLLIKGGDAVIPAGTQITVTTISAADIAI